jgi:hypothetical protein
MFSWFTKPPDPVQPLPLSRREKSYSAASGLVYQYIFSGLAGTQNVFLVSAGRQAPFELRIDLGEEALRPCNERMGSELRWNEKYALAKLCLFASLDSAASADELRQVICPPAEELLEHMNTLNMA